ncbi:serine/threonine-protein kinase [Euzebya sp.]|uniref:serine/threonine-protein kinase n=1 Tax=Euzebya sp. TaxID=1971409 RepID=UPI003513EA21
MTTRLLGRYRLEELLGTGAFATVHRAHDEQLDDWVAVKVLAANHAANPDIRRRFIAEGQILRRLSSPHVMTVHDLAETEDGSPFLVLELCDRGTLRDRAVEARGRGWRPTEADVVTIAIALAAAVATMASEGVVHRDLTPANVLVTTRPPRVDTTVPPSSLIGEGERLVVTDLGFCKDLKVNSGISATGGTEGFRAPEQRIPGQPVDVRTDIWAASAVLTWVLTDGTFEDVAQATSALEAAGLTAGLSAAVAAGLARGVAERPATPEAWLGGIVDAAPSVDVSKAALAVAHTATPASRWSPGRVIAVTAALTVIAIAAAVAAAFGNDRDDAMAQFGDQDVSGLSLADLDDLAAGDDPTAELQVDPEGVVTDQVGPREQHRWQFHVVDHLGWEYDIDVAVDAAFYFAKDISDSPPGIARLVSAVSGGIDLGYTSTLEGREAPRLRWPLVEAVFPGRPVDVFWTRRGPCDALPRRWDAIPDQGIVCRLTEGYDGQAITSESPQLDEADLDGLLAGAEELVPSQYVFDIPVGGFCEVILRRDGTVALHPIRNDYVLQEACELSGDQVVEMSRPS